RAGTQESQAPMLRFARLALGSGSRSARARALAALVRNTTFTISALPLHQGAVVKATVEPVLIARHVLLHRDIDEGLIQRDARDVGISQIDEALHVLVVAGLVALRRRGDRAVDQRVHILLLGAHCV